MWPIFRHREPRPVSARGFEKGSLLEVVGAGVELARYGVAPVLRDVGVEDLRGATHVGHRLDNQRLARHVGYDAIPGVLVDYAHVSAPLADDLLHVAAFVPAVLHVYRVVAAPAEDVVVAHLPEDAIVAPNPLDYLHA